MTTTDNPKHYVAKDRKPCGTCGGIIRYVNGHGCIHRKDADHVEAARQRKAQRGQGFAAPNEASADDPGVEFAALAPAAWAPAGFAGGYPVTLDKGELPVFDARLDNLCGYYCYTVDGVAHHAGKTGRWKRRKGTYRSNPDAANRRIREWIRYHIRAGQTVHMWGLVADAPTQGEERAIAARLGATRWSGALPEMIDGCLRSAKAHLAHALTRSDDAAIATAALKFLAAFELQEAAR